jgi:hypothetical protein
MKIKKKYKMPALIVVLLVVLIVVLINPTGKVVVIKLKDSCGPMMNLISHTIKDEDSCNYKCKAQCGTIDLELDESEFVLNPYGCHNCTCYCK